MYVGAAADRSRLCSAERSSLLLGSAGVRAIVAAVGLEMCRAEVADQRNIVHAIQRWHAGCRVPAFGERPVRRPWRMIGIWILFYGAGNVCFKR